MARELQYGVFIPVSSGGWIPSLNAPVIDGSYASNREIVRLAEQLGFHFVLSQATWRGHGGGTRHFDDNLESLTAAAGLSEISERTGVWGTVNTALLHPAVASKVIATVDQISGGRSGLNIVAGGNRASERQMGLDLMLANPEKYRRASEWITIVKRLWTEPSVDFDGEFFTLKDCQSGPKPVQGVPPMICAATSDEGLRFTAEHLDGVMFEGPTDERVIELGTRAQRISGEHGGRLRNLCIFMIVPGETDAEAQRRVELYSTNKDWAALNNIARENGWLDKSRAVDPTSNRALAPGWMNTMAFGTGTIAGSSATIAEHLEELAERAFLDSVIFIMPDFIRDLRVIGEDVLPRLERDGYGTRLSEPLRPLVRS